MKKRLVIAAIAGTLLLTACGALPNFTSTVPSASPQTGPGQITEPAWEAYTNSEAGFSIRYPSTWQIEALPDENAGQLHRMALSGPEGEFELGWGVGLGGACPEGYQSVKVAQGELPACHTQNPDGTEQWSLAGMQLGEISFTAIAHTNNAEPNSRDLVLQILSTLSFP